jgi:hypothetical protein
MHARRNSVFVAILFVLFAIFQAASAATRKTHTVVLGAVRKVPYTKAGDPAGAAAGDAELKIRALLVDGAVKEWTTGDAHDVTGRSFVVRRVMRLNDTLPGDKQEHWVWQRGPWLLVDGATGRVTALKLPDYDPGVSQVSWFRDYAAYCGLTPSGKNLYAVVAQVAARKPILAKKLEAAGKIAQPAPAAPPTPEAPAVPSGPAAPAVASAPAATACAAPEWQREPLRVTFHRAGKEAVSYDIVPGSAVLVEGTGDEAEKPEASK